VKNRSAGECVGKSGKQLSAKRAVIIETGGDWLKIAEIQPCGKGIAVSKLHLEKVGDDAGLASRALAQACRTLKLDRSSVVACLPRQMVNIRMLELPSADPAEIEDMVELQVGKQTPYSRDEIVYDYRILGSWKPGYTRVMMAIIQRSALRERYYVFEEAGVNVSKVSVTSEALLNWYAFVDNGNADDKATALLDIDSFYTDFLVISDKGLVFSRSILVGANQLIDDPDNFADKFSREVKNSMEICRGEQQGLSLSRVLISGAGANVGGIAVRLNRELGLKCEIVESAGAARKMPGSPSVKEANYRYVSITPLIGAGLDTDALEFNLVPDSVRLRKGLSEKARNLSVMGMLIMAGLVFLSLFGTLKLFARKAYLGEMLREYSELRPQAEKIDQMREISRLAAEQRDPSQNMIILLSRIRGLLGDDVKLENFEIEVGAGSGKFRVEGNASSSREVYSLVRRIEQAENFCDVKESGIASVPKTGRFRFQIAGMMEKTK
jgi:Tfp pilus assembly PilM family ATPase